MTIKATYYDKKTPVEVGDHVEVRFFFIKHKGRVVYVPGISSPDEHFQGQGFEQVGIDVENGPFLLAMVDPYEGWLRRGIKFIRHDSSPVISISELEKTFDEDDEW